MSVVPLFCSKFIRSGHGNEAHGDREGGFLERLLAPFNRGYSYVLKKYDESIETALKHPKMTVAVVMGAFVLSLALSPLLGVAFLSAHGTPGSSSLTSKRRAERASS